MFIELSFHEIILKKVSSAQKMLSTTVSTLIINVSWAPNYDFWRNILHFKTHSSRKQFL